MNNKNSIRSNNNYGTSAANIPTSTSPAPSTSPSISLPPLKKRTAVVKTSVPPPVPPRGSPRARGDHYNKSKSTALIKTLTSLNDSQLSGQEKVEDWLAQKAKIANGRLQPLPVIRSKAKKLPVPIPNKIDSNKTSHDEFKSVKSLIESFSKSTSDPNYIHCTRKVSDLQMVKNRIELISQSTEIQAISRRKADIMNQMGGGCSVLHARTNSAFATLVNRFSLEGEFV